MDVPKRVWPCKIALLSWADSDHRRRPLLATSLQFSGPCFCVRVCTSHSHAYCVYNITLWVETSRSTVHSWAPRKEEAYWVLVMSLAAFNKSWIPTPCNSKTHCLRQFIYIYPLVPEPPNKHFRLWSKNHLWGSELQSVNYHSEGFGRYRSHWEVVIQIRWAITISLPLKLPQTRTGTWLCPRSCLGCLILPLWSIGRKGRRERRKMGGGNNYFLEKKKTWILNTQEFYEPSTYSCFPTFSLIESVLVKEAHEPAAHGLLVHVSVWTSHWDCTPTSIDMVMVPHFRTQQESSSITSPGEWHWAHLLETLEFSEVWESRQPGNVAERLCVKVCLPISSVCKDMSLDHLKGDEKETPSRVESRKCAQFLCRHYQTVQHPTAIGFEESS